MYAEIKQLIIVGTSFKNHFIGESALKRQFLHVLDECFNTIKNAPKIICLCGSTRFKDAFEKANREETLKGNIVLSVGYFGHLESIFTDEKIKEDLDKLHLQKIALADEVLFLNVNGYIGSSTQKELNFAKSIGKVIRFLEPENSTPFMCTTLPLTAQN